jgi:hypothetical protein
MPAINYKFSTEDKVYFLGVLPEGTRVLVHVTNSILESKVQAVNINISNAEFITYNIITTNLTHNKIMRDVKEEYVFKTKAGALCAAIKEVERRKAVLQEDLNKRIGVLDQLVTAIKCHNMPA